MPPRISRANGLAAAPKTAKNKNKKRSFDAYAAAAKQLPAPRIRNSRNRLGEVEDTEPRSKRSRKGEESDNDEDEDDAAPTKRPVKRTMTDGDMEHGSDSSGNEWVLGGLAEDDDDSDIDSDEAFGDSDEEKFSGFTFRGGSKSKSKKPTKKTGRDSKVKPRSEELDLNEEEEEVTDDGDSEDDIGAGFGDDGVDLAAMLDDDDEDLMGGNDKTMHDLGEDSASGSGFSDEEDEEGDLPSQSEDDEDDGADDEERIARMQDRLERLNPESRNQSASSAPVQAATLDDFLEDTQFEASGLNKSKGKKDRLTKAAPIAAPLPKRQQDRIDRQVATEKANEQLNRWKDTVTKNRRAEFLTFPLQRTADQLATIGKDKFIPTSQEAPRNELEENILRIMEESGLATKGNAAGSEDDEEGALLKSEELAIKKLPVEEVLRRRAELRRTRDLLFREEIKAKRVAKIKSKSYRRVHRKERARLAEQEKAALEEMGLDGMDEDEKEKNDRRRAEARMGTKHKESKWAKSLKATGRAAWDDAARDGVYEQARREEELKRRIDGRDVSDSDDNEPSSDDADSEDDAQGATTLHQLRELENDHAEPKGLAGLKFMVAADNRRKKANEEDIQRLRKELAIADGDESEGDEDADESLGRAIFGPQSQDKASLKPQEQRLEFEAPEDSESDNEASRESQRPSSKQTSAPNPNKPNVKRAPSPEHRLATTSTGDASKTQSSWLQAPKAKSKKSSTVDDSIAIVTDLTESAGPNKAVSKSMGKSKAAQTSGEAREATADTQGWTNVPIQSGSNDDSDEEDLNPIQQNALLKQRAFAGDDVQVAFDAEKADLALSEDEKETSSYLPGWGAWAGEGLSKKDKKFNTRAKHNPLLKSKVDGIKPEQRKDAKLKNVIISEKNERKGRKYLATQLPHQFESKEQYERSRRLPMGPEWTTKEMHQRQTRPRVVVKPGVPIRALERPVV